MGTNLKHLGTSDLAPGLGRNTLVLAQFFEQSPSDECYRATHERTDCRDEQVAIGLSFNCNGAKYGSDDKREPAISIQLCYPTHSRRLHGVFGLLH